MKLCKRGHPQTPENVYVRKSGTAECYVCKNGHPRRVKPSIREVFTSRIRTSEGCWEWTGSVSSTGYGTFRYAGVGYSAHRFAHEMFIGPIPAGLVVMHSCDNPKCVNPDHLRAGTYSDNSTDMVRKGRARPWLANVTECRRGHALSGENLYLTTKGTRACRECARIHRAMHEAKPGYREQKIARDRARRARQSVARSA